MPGIPVRLERHPKYAIVPSLYICTTRNNTMQFSRCDHISIAHTHPLPRNIDTYLPHRCSNDKPFRMHNPPDDILSRTNRVTIPTNTYLRVYHFDNALCAWIIPFETANSSTYRRIVKSGLRDSYIRIFRNVFIEAGWGGLGYAVAEVLTVP